MFWKKQTSAVAEKPKQTPAPPREVTPEERLEEATITLAASLASYSDAAYRASEFTPDAETEHAFVKLEAARKLVTEGRLAYALGRCLPEHVKYWPSWIRREGFEKHVGFAATDISATQAKANRGNRKKTRTTVHFTFKNKRYRFVLRDKGMSYAPEHPVSLGEVELHEGGQMVARFEVEENLMEPYSRWKYSDVRGLKVGPWMQDVLDMAAQIDAAGRRFTEEFQVERTKAAARNIDLG